MRWYLLLLLAVLASCRDSSGTGPPPGGWANAAPTVVERVVNRKASQLLEVRQGQLTTWIEIPAIGAKVGDYLLLGQGSARENVAIAEIGVSVAQLVDIKHAKVVSLEAAKRAIAAAAPGNAVAIGTIYAELDQRRDKEVVVYGTAVKVANAIGWNWVHLQDGTGDVTSDTNDLTIKTQVEVAEGQRVAFRGVLRKDVDLGFGYRYTALVEEGRLVD